MCIVHSPGRQGKSYLQPGQSFEVFESLGVNSSDLIDIEVQFRCLPGDASGNLFQLGMTASDHSARARALGRAIIVSKASFRIVA